MRSAPAAKIWFWLLVSIVLTYVIQGLPGTIFFGLMMLAGDPYAIRHSVFEVVPVWTHPEWIGALAAYAIVMGLLAFLLRQRVTGWVLIVTVVSTVVYLLTAGLLIDPDGTTRSSSDDVQLIALYSFGVWGNAWVALGVPLFVAALPKSRTFFYRRERRPRNGADDAIEDGPNL